MSWGITAKYIQGLFYLGVDEDSSSSNLITDDLGIYGSGKYILKQGVGGSGFGFDVGVVTRDYNGNLELQLLTSLVPLGGNRI